MPANDVELRAKPLEIVPDPIVEKLPTDASMLYLRTARVAVRQKMINALRNTPRWVDDDSDKTINPDFQENDLDHVLELIEMANDVERNYPQLYLELTDGKRENWLTLLTALIIHDIGEVVVGDMARTHSGFHTVYGRTRKLREARAARKLIHWAVPEKAKDLLDIYERYDRREESDKLIRFGHTLDKGQASANVARHVLPFNKKSAGKGYSYIKDLVDSLEASMDHARVVGSHLQSHEAIKQLRNFLEKHILSCYWPLIRELKEEDADALRLSIQIKYRDILL
ncbi:HD domain-containing protein [Candidatus Peregrinibacteria bacterium]|nr:HD domain-containing protein [Candidatus Peregrinibacteria bacterium]